MREIISLQKLKNMAQTFLDKNKDLDHVVIEGDNCVLISVPHGVFQVREGKEKPSEMGSVMTALHLQRLTHSYLIAKTKTNNDDANYDSNCPYRETISKLIESGKIKYILDIHGLAFKREMDINLGTNDGRNIRMDNEVFNGLVRNLQDNGISASIDHPFKGGDRTIAGTFASKYDNVWTLQIEVNARLTYNEEELGKYSKLFGVFSDWIKSLK